MPRCKKRYRRKGNILGPHQTELIPNKDERSLDMVMGNNGKLSRNPDTDGKIIGKWTTAI